MTGGAPTDTCRSLAPLAITFVTSSAKSTMGTVRGVDGARPPGRPGPERPPWYRPGPPGAQGPPAGPGPAPARRAGRSAQWVCSAAQPAWWQWHSTALGLSAHQSEQNWLPSLASQVQVVCAQTAIGAPPGRCGASVPAATGSAHRPGELLEARVARQHLQQAVLAQGAHPLAARLAGDLLRGGALDGHPLERLAHHQHLVD